MATRSPTTEADGTPEPDASQSRRSPSVRDVAARARVSVGTVSNVLNRPQLVAPETRLRIERAMEELGFVPNRSARHLRRGWSGVLGVQVLDVANPFWGDVVRGVEAMTDKADYAIMVCSSGEVPDKESRNVRALREHGVDGLLIAPVRDDTEALVALERSGVPVVLLDHVSPDGRLCSVAVDDVHGGEIAAHHALAAGHRHVALVNGPPSIAWCADRRAGARGAAERRGLNPDAVIREVRVAAMTAREGESAVEEIAALAPAPTALICANDLLALGVLRGLARRGIRVPADMALIGYDDVDFAAVLSPPLTTVRQPPYQLGYTATELLFDHLRDRKSHQHRQLVFQPELIVRESA